MAGLESAIQINSSEQFDDWLTANSQIETEVWLALFKKSSRKQTVTFDELLEVGMCHGWIDVKTKRIDDDLYAIRFTPRRPNSNWSPKNREIVKRLRAQGRLKPTGIAALPPDL